MKRQDIYKIIIIILTLMIISVIIIFNVQKIIQNIDGNDEELIYSSKNLDTSNYEVHLKNNSYIDKNILTENYSYITSLIDKIRINFNFNSQLDKEVNLVYSYNITANMLALLNKDSVISTKNPILDKTYVIKESTEFEPLKKDLKINEIIDLNLTDYNYFIEQFITDLNISLNTSLNVKLSVNIKGQIENTNINKTYDIISSIPLGVKAFDITLSNNIDEDERVFSKEQPTKESLYVKIIVFIFIDFLLIFMSIYLIKKITYKYRSKFFITINKILKDYSNRIIEVNNFVNIENWEVIDVKDFKELIELSNEAFEPIFYFRRKFNHNSEAWFCILRDKILYRYTIYKKEAN